MTNSSAVTSPCSVVAATGIPQTYVLVAGGLNSSGFGPTTYNSTTVNGAVLTGQIPDGYDLGNILAPFLDFSTLAAQLTLKFQVAAGGLSFKTAELQIVTPVPEPTVLSLIGIGAGAILARRRRNKQA